MASLRHGLVLLGSKSLLSLHVRSRVYIYILLSIQYGHFYGSPSNISIYRKLSKPCPQKYQASSAPMRGDRFTVWGLFTEQ